MQRNFVQVKEFLAGNYPNSFGQMGANITGENYPAPPYANVLMGIIQFLQMALLAFALMGESVFNVIPFTSSANPPDWYKQGKENPMLVLAAVFFIAPTIANSLVTSGAFEVALDGEVVYSKIEMGRFPTGPELLELMSKAGLVAVRAQSAPM
jgi:selT/selW/selH-like putative selenoprotein